MTRESSVSKRTKKRTLDALSVSAFVAWLGFLYMRYFFYESAAPTSYDAASGHIYEVNNHGYRFYLDATQNLLTYCPLVAALGLLLSLFLLEKRWGIYKEAAAFRHKPLTPC